jgi:hypothetical protein
MSGHSIFDESRRRRAAITPVSEVQPERNILSPVTDVVGGTVSFAQNLFQGIKGAPSAGIEHLARTVVGPQGQTEFVDPSGGMRRHPRAIEEFIQNQQSRINEIRREVLDAPDSAFLTPELRQAREQEREQAEADIETINEEINTLNAQLEGVQETFEVGNQFLEALGLPTTVSAAREDPEINAGLNAITTALASGDPDKLDAAIDKLAAVGEDQLDDLGEAFGRDRYLSDLQRSIRTQLHNLVENRQQVEDNLLAAEDWIELEAQSQADPLWDMEIDPTPGGRGADTVINHMEVWLQGAFNGVMSEDQFAIAAERMIGIWQSLPSVEVETDPETGEVVEVDIMTDLAEAAIMELAMGNPTEGTIGLGFTLEKAQAMVEEMRAALKLGVQARADADGWKSQTSLSNVSLGMAAGSLALEIYEDPEIASQIANSWYLHRIVQVRSKGSTARKEGMSNQFGLGNLPEHTYEWMGYTLSRLEDNPELQMEALLNFIGRKFGAGYLGLEAAYSELVHNPDAWGDPPEGQG